MKRLTLIGLLFVLILAPRASFAYSSNICKAGGATTCSEVEVGPFMMGISKVCGNLGDCTLDDILTVFVNVGNYVIGIIGAVVLLMYVAGGFYWLSSAGNPERVKKGKQYMTISTVGLLIVMFSYLGIYALKGTLVYGTASVEGDYVTCSGTDTLGDPCGINSTCTENGCESKCRQNNPTPVYEEGPDITVINYYDCVDIDTFPDDFSEGNPYRSGSCQPNLCYGGASTQCCQLQYSY